MNWCPVVVVVIGMCSNLSSALLPAIADTASSPSPSTLTVKPGPAFRCGNVREVFITDTSTRGGSNDTPMNDWQVMPTVRPSALRPVTTHTPLGKRPRTVRSARVSARSIVVSMPQKYPRPPRATVPDFRSPETTSDPGHTGGAQ